MMIVLAAVAIGSWSGGCSYRLGQSLTTSEPPAHTDITGSIAPVATPASKAAGPTESDLAFARIAASDVLTRGGKDLSQPWENPKTGARGSVTPLSNAYIAEGFTCRDFLASYVNGSSEAWLQGEACKTASERWEIRSMRPWKRS